MKDALRAYAIAAGCWIVWDLSLFAAAPKPYPRSLWWSMWQKEFEFYPLALIAVLLLVVLGGLRLRKKRREKEGIDITFYAEKESTGGITSSKARWFGASGLASACAVLGLGVYMLCLLVGLLLSLIVPDTFEKMWPDWAFVAIKHFVGIPMSVGAGVGFVTARDRDPSSIKPSDLLRGDSHWD